MEKRVLRLREMRGDGVSKVYERRAWQNRRFGSLPGALALLPSVVAILFDSFAAFEVGRKSRCLKLRKLQV